MTVREINGIGSTACNIRCVMKATRKVGAIRGKVGVAKEVGGGCGRRNSSSDQIQLTLIGEEAGIILVKCL